MSTTAQITANRANAQQSTGAITPEGIRNSKHNATRHGLSGKQVVIKGEDPAEYDAFRAQLLADYAPATEREAMLVEEIAQNWWRLQRGRRVEAQVVEKLGEVECIVDPEARKAFNTITRYIHSIERSWRKACDQLDALLEIRSQQQELRKTKIHAREYLGSPDLAAPPIGFVSQPVSSPPSQPLKEAATPIGSVSQMAAPSPGNFSDHAKKCA